MLRTPFAGNCQFPAISPMTMGVLLGLMTASAGFGQPAESLFGNAVIPPDTEVAVEQEQEQSATQVTRIKSIPPAKAVEVIKEVYGDQGELLKIVTADETQTIILRGPEKLVRDAASFLNKLDQSADVVQVEAEFDVSLDQSPEHWVALDEPIEPRVELELAQLEAVEHHRQLMQLSQEFQKSKQAGEKKAMQKVEHKVRSLLSKLHEKRLSQQHDQVERLERGLEKLKERIEKRRREQEADIETAVRSVLQGDIEPKIHAYQSGFENIHSYGLPLGASVEYQLLTQRYGPDHPRRRAMERAIEAASKQMEMARRRALQQQDQLNELEIQNAQGFLRDQAGYPLEEAGLKKAHAKLETLHKEVQVKLEMLHKEMHDKAKEIEQVERELRKKQRALEQQQPRLDDGRE